ncbi:MAG: VPLPA-CTERM sorting domain-containing protein [Octadecabacter sp.]
MKLMNTAFAAILAVAGTAASAAPLTLDAGWSSFDFEDVGSAWSETFTFTIASNAFFAVTDAYLSGDQFQFFVDGVSAGVTSAPTSQGDQISDSWDLAYADSRWSSGELELTAGTYEISGLTTLSPFGSGSAAVQLSSTSLGGPTIQPSAVPIPAAGFLLFGALGGLAAFGRRKDKSA